MSFFLLIVLVFLIKNSFLINLSIFYFSVFFVILIIQIFVSLKALFSDFLKFLFLISISLSFFDVISADFLVSLVDQNMCLHCSKQLIKDSEIHYFCFNKYQKCFYCKSNKIQCVKMSIFYHLNDSELTLLDF